MLTKFGLIIKCMVILTMLTLLLSAAFAQSEGISVSLQLPFDKTVKTVVERAGSKKKLMLLVKDTTEVTFSCVEPMSVEKILTEIAESRGYDFWQDDKNYYIGILEVANVDTKATPFDPSTIAGAISTPPSSTPTASNGLTGAVTGPNTKHNYTTLVEHETLRPKRTVKKSITLQYSKASEVVWVLTGDSNVVPTADRRRVMRNRIQTVFDPRRNSNINADSNGYVSPMLGGILPSQGGYLGVNGSSGRANQIGVNPTNPNNNNNNNNETGVMGSTGGLAAFLPTGIGSIVGFDALGMILVSALDGPMIDQNGNLMVDSEGNPLRDAQGNEMKYDGEEIINQLMTVILAIDQPIKQVIIEAMFVKMSTSDALSLGSSWSLPGSPWSAEASNGLSGDDLNFRVLYMKNNLQYEIKSLVSETKAKVMNAPRVIVQNGSSASITFNQTIPFYTKTTEEDAFGRITTNITIQTQTFTQGLDVNGVTIHPHGYVTMDVTPRLEDPGELISIGGEEGGGGIAGGNTTEIFTVVRVKSGESIMMGGFISVNSTVGKKKIPFLSDIPLLGDLLFSNKITASEETEILIYLTPTIMEDDAVDFENLLVPALF